MNPTPNVNTGDGASATTDTTVRGLAQEARSTVHDVSAAASRGARNVAEQTRASASEIASDIEALVRKIGPAASAEVRDLLNTLRDRASSLTHSMRDVSLKARDQAQHGADKTRDVVRDHPLQAIVAAALAGAAIGMLLASRRHRDE